MNIDLRDPNLHYHEDDLTMIAYFNGKRIVKDSVDNLYYESIPKSSITSNDMLNRERLTSITKLPAEEQMNIQEFCIKEGVL